MSPVYHISTNLILAGILLTLLFAASCTTQRRIRKEPIKEEGADFLFQKLKENELKFDWFQAKFSADYRNNSQKLSFNGQIRIRKDSLIWLSLTPMMGIEAMRLMISQDSIKYVNRINKTFFIGDYEYLNRFLNTQIDFDILQSFLIGNDLSFYENGKFRANLDKGEYRLSTAARSKLKKYVRNSSEALKVFIQNIWLNPETFKIVRADVKEVRKEQIRLEANYGSFDEVDGQLFPKETVFHIFAENEIVVNTSFLRISINSPLQFPYKIPDSYRQIR